MNSDYSTNDIIDIVSVGIMNGEYESVQHHVSSMICGLDTDMFVKVSAAIDLALSAHEYNLDNTEGYGVSA